MQSLLMQGLLAAALLLMAWLSRADPKARSLYLVSVAIPAAWAFVAWTAHKRVEKARREGAWTPAWEKAQTRKAMGTLGVVFLLWVVAVGLVAFYL